MDDVLRRRLHAQLLDRLRAEGVAQVVYDVQFTEPSSFPKDDLALYDAVGRTGRERTSRTRPVAVSSARRRWETADGVRSSARAAPSSVPASTAATSARSWRRSKS